jgi:acylglycerol lipase
MPFKVFVVMSVLLSGCAAVGPIGSPRPLPAPPPDVIHAEGSFIGTGGVRLFEQSWRPNADARAVLVLIHGLKDHSSRYAEVATQLAHNGIAVFAFDLRGHGRSEGDRQWVDKFDDYLEDLGIFVDSVRKQEPAKPLFLFGHSMGGAIVTLYTLTREPYVQGIILSGPAIHVDVSGIVMSSTELLGTILPTLAVLDLKAEDFSRDPAVVEDQRADPLVAQSAGPARTAAQLFEATERIETLARELNVPALFMHGSADKLTDPEGTKRLYALDSCQDKTLKIYEGMFHDLLHEPERAKVMDDFIGWVGARADFSGRSSGGPTCLGAGEGRSSSHP